MGKDHAKILQTLYVLKSCIRHNDGKAVNSVISTHDKKLKNLTKYSQIWFKSEETIKNFLS